MAGHSEAEHATAGHTESGKAIFAALAANLGIAITKFIAYLLTHSASMLAESIHSAADSGNQLLLLVGGRQAKKARDARHPFGHGRARYFYAFLVAVVLFTLGGLFALYEAWHKLADPHPITEWQAVPVIVLVLALTMEGFSLRTAVKEAAKSRGERSWWQFIRTSKAPELPVVLLEDTAAEVGLVFALIGVVGTLITGDGRWDAAGSAAIGLVLIAVAAILAIEMQSLLMGEAARTEDLDAIEAALVGEGITSVIHMRTQHLGPEELLVAAKIELAPVQSAAAVADAINAAEARVRAAVPIARDIYLEPDVRILQDDSPKT